jgi:hypothetical protein
LASPGRERLAQQDDTAGCGRRLGVGLQLLTVAESCGYCYVVDGESPKNVHQRSKPAGGC